MSGKLTSFHFSGSFQPIPMLTGSDMTWSGPSGDTYFTHAVSLRNTCKQPLMYEMRGLSFSILDSTYCPVFSV